MVSVFFLNFLFAAKVMTIVKEDIVKSGYKPEIMYKSSIILLYFWLCNKVIYKVGRLGGENS